MTDFRPYTCCFTGHRDIRPGDGPLLEANLEHLLRRLIRRDGVRYFGAGGALGFDTLAARKVLSMKAEFPQIKLILVLPCKDQTARWRQSDAEQHGRICRQADKVVCLADAYYSGCMQARNRHLVDNAEWCLCYL